MKSPWSRSERIINALLPRLHTPVGMVQLERWTSSTPNYSEKNLCTKRNGGICLEPIKTTKQQLQEERRKNMALTARLEQTEATLVYVAMMTRVELDSDTEEENRNVEEV